MLALNYFCNMPLYKSKGVFIDDKWEEMFNRDMQIRSIVLLSIESDSFNHDKKLEYPSKTMLHGYGKSSLIDDYVNQMIETTPSEGFKPLGIF